MDQQNPENLIDRAIEVAVKAHKRQKRKGTSEAYIIHPFAVGILLAKAGCSEEVIAAGILHDVVEDTRVKPDRIREEFGDTVASIVKQCTEPDKRRSWEKRKKHTLDLLKEADDEVKLVVCADKLHNIRTLARDYLRAGDRVWRRFRRGREDQRWYYESLVQVLPMKEAPASYQELFTAFERKVGEVFHGERRRAGVGFTPDRGRTQGAPLQSHARRHQDSLRERVFEVRKEEPWAREQKLRFSISKKKGQ